MADQAVNAHVIRSGRVQKRREGVPAVVWGVPCGDAALGQGRAEQLVVRGFCQRLAIVWVADEELAVGMAVPLHESMDAWMYGDDPVLSRRSLHASPHRPFRDADIRGFHGEKLRDPPPGVDQDEDGVGIWDGFGVPPEALHFILGKRHSGLVILRFCNMDELGVVLVYDVMFRGVLEHLVQKVYDMLHVCVGQ